MKFYIVLLIIYKENKIETVFVRVQRRLVCKEKIVMFIISNGVVKVSNTITVVQYSHIHTICFNIQK